MQTIERQLQLHLNRIEDWADNNTGELGYAGPLYDRLLAMTDDMLGPIPVHIKYVYWTMHKPDSVCRNSVTMDQYQSTHDAIYDVISIVYAGQTRVISEFTCISKLSQSKSVFVHFCRRSGLHPNPHLVLYDNPIPVKKDTNFLGILLEVLELLGKRRVFYLRYGLVLPNA